MIWCIRYSVLNLVSHADTHPLRDRGDTCSTSATWSYRPPDLEEKRINQWISQWNYFNMCCLRPIKNCIFKFCTKKVFIVSQNSNSEYLCKGKVAIYLCVTVQGLQSLSPRGIKGINYATIVYFVPEIYQTYMTT